MIWNRTLLAVVLAIAALTACSAPAPTENVPEEPSGASLEDLPGYAEMDPDGASAVPGDTVAVDVRLYRRIAEDRMQMIESSSYRYRSTDSSVVSMLSLGLALAVAPGTAEILVSASGVEARVPITVTSPPTAGGPPLGGVGPVPGAPDDEVPADVTVEVHPGDDLVGIVASAPPGSSIYLHGQPDGSGFTYDIGDRVLTLSDNSTIRGPETVRGPNGEITAPVRVRGSGPQIFNQQNRTGWTIEHLDISGARFVSDKNQDGVGINRGTGTVRYVKIHDNDNKGLGGWSGLLEYSELTNNSAARIPGHSAASKSIYVHSVWNSYIHRNHFNGLWTDCDNPGWTVVDNVITDNFGSGVFNEISKGPTLIARNRVERNNTGNVAGRGGLVVTSSKNVQVLENIIRLNGREDVRVWEDDRAGTGPAGCRSGYRTENVVLANNISGNP